MILEPTRSPTPPALPVFPIGTSIPRVIHQVYFPGKPPAVIQENVDKIRALNPGWTYKLYDDRDMADFIEQHYGKDVQGYFDRINRKYGACRADLFRYLLMYKEGGVYLDIKSSMEKPLDLVLRTDDVFLLSRWRNAEGEAYEGWGMHTQLKRIGGSEFQQWHIIAVAGHPFLRAVIERVVHHIDIYNPLIHYTGKRGVLWVSGPIPYTQSITPLLGQQRHRVVDSQNDLGFTYSIFGAAGSRAHKALFKFHYTDLIEPVTEISGARRHLWRVLGPIQTHLIDPGRELMNSLSRRLAIRQPRRG